ALAVAPAAPLHPIEQALQRLDAVPGRRAQLRETPARALGGGGVGPLGERAIDVASPPHQPLAHVQLGQRRARHSRSAHPAATVARALRLRQARQRYWQTMSESCPLNPGQNVGVLVASLQRGLRQPLHSLIAYGYSFVFTELPSSSLPLS